MRERGVARWRDGAPVSRRGAARSRLRPPLDQSRRRQRVQTRGRRPARCARADLRVAVGGSSVARGGVRRERVAQRARARGHVCANDRPARSQSARRMARVAARRGLGRARGTDRHGNPGMNARTWATREPITPEFERAWRERLSRTPHAHFGFDPAFLRWEADHGRAALAALVEEGPGRGALVLREQGGGRVSGFPWRWEAVIEDAGRISATGLTAAECDWLFGAAVTLAQGRRLHCYLPESKGDNGAGFPAGSTLLRSLDLTDEQMLMTMDVNKRRAVKRAQREGFTVVPATTHEQFLAFARLQLETEKRRGQESGVISELPPEPGESWREWELPWMLLLVAVKGGRQRCR